MINFVVAVAAEARPVVRRYRMSQDRASTGFRVYEADGVRLIVTGVGKINAAAGVSYLAGRAGGPDQVWVNVGLAGHGRLPPGTGLRAVKITDRREARSWYPPQILGLPGVGAAVETYDAPVADYPTSAACDMEASAFYRTATRFSTSELVQCYKVISDNPATPAGAVGPGLAERLIGEKTEELDVLVNRLRSLACSLPAAGAAGEAVAEFTSHWRFTANQRIQLEEALRRLELRAPAERVTVASWRDCGSARQLLAAMRRYLDSLPVTL